MASLTAPLNRIDANAAWLFNTPPACSMYKSRFVDTSSASSVLQHVRSRNPFNNNSNNDRLKNFLSGPLFSIACDLACLTYLLDLHEEEENRIGIDEREYFEDTFAACQHGLASFPRLATIPVKLKIHYQQECFRLSAFIYFNTTIRGCPSPALLYTMTTSLIEYLRESDLPSLWHPYQDILLWCLFMGYCGSGIHFKRVGFYKS